MRKSYCPHYSFLFFILFLGLTISSCDKSDTEDIDVDIPDIEVPDIEINLDTSIYHSVDTGGVDIDITITIGGSDQADCWNTSGYASEGRSLPSFRKIRTTGLAHVCVKKGNNQKVTIKAKEESSLALVETNVFNNRLIISTSNDYASYGIEYVVEITMPQIKELATSSVANIRVTKDIDAEQLLLTTESTGKIHTKNVDCDRLEIRAESTGNIITGKINADVVRAKTQSSGDITIEKIDGEDIEFTVLSTGDLKAVVDAQTVYVTGASSGDLEINGKADNFYIELESIGDFTGNLEVDWLRTTSTSSGNIYLSGSANTHEIYLYNLGDIFCYEMIAKKCEVISDGLGDCKVNVRDELSVYIENIGDVYYKGTPNITQLITGLGELIDDN